MSDDGLRDDPEPPWEPATPEPVLAKDTEGPVTGGVWYAACPSCCRVTTWAGFTDEHGCEVGGGCIECRYIFNYRGCAYARATVTTIEAFKQSLQIRGDDRCPEQAKCVRASSSNSQTLARAR